MPETYFKQLIAETPTRVWVNNPTIAEMDLALAQGAQGSTTNPAYGGQSPPAGAGGDPADHRRVRPPVRR